MTHKVTEESRKMVENATGMGLRQEEIALLLGISDKTLRKRYKAELAVGGLKANMQVATTLFSKACAGNMTAVIWWEKTRAGKSDRLTLTTPRGEPFETAELPAEPDNIGKYHERLRQIAADRAARRLAPAVARAGVPEDDDGEGPGEG